MRGIILDFSGYWALSPSISFKSGLATWGAHEAVRFKALKKTGTLSGGEDLNFKSCAARTAACMTVVLEELGKRSENIFSWDINIEEVQSDPVSKRQSLHGKKLTNLFLSLCVTNLPQRPLLHNCHI